MCSDKIFGKTFVYEKTIADFIRLKTFLEANISGVKLMIFLSQENKNKKQVCQFTFKHVKHVKCKPMVEFT